MDQDLLNIAEMLESEAKRLRKKAFDNRPMPDSWRVGQKVRLLKNKEWCADAGDVLMIVEVRDHNVFWTSPPNGTGRYWTTPDEVELVEDV